MKKERGRSRSSAIRACASRVSGWPMKRGQWAYLENRIYDKSCEFPSVREGIAEEIGKTSSNEKQEELLKKLQENAKAPLPTLREGKDGQAKRAQGGCLGTGSR